MTRKADGLTFDEVVDHLFEPVTMTEHDIIVIGTRAARAGEQHERRATRAFIRRELAKPGSGGAAEGFALVSRFLDKRSKSRSAR